MESRICSSISKIKPLCFSTMGRSSGHSSHENTSLCSANGYRRGRYALSPQLMKEVTMDEHLQQDIKQILDHLDAEKNTSPSQPDENRQGIEFIDWFILRRQMEGPELPAVAMTSA